MKIRFLFMAFFVVLMLFFAACDNDTLNNLGGSSTGPGPSTGPAQQPAQKVIPNDLKNTTWSNSAGDTIAFTTDSVKITPQGSSAQTFKLKDLLIVEQLDRTMLFFGDQQTKNYIVYFQGVVTTVDFDIIAQRDRTDGWTSHTHTYSTMWTPNATQHWRECTANDGAKTGTANHTYDANYKCTVCGYQHTHTNIWSYNTTQHWHECSCGDKISLANHTYDANYKCTVCGYTHTHTYDANYKCTVCGYQHIHSYSATWSTNATQHWHECTANDGAKTDTANHDWNNDTGPCTSNCGELYYQLGATGPGGGKIFYRIATGFTMTDNSQICHYLEAAPTNQGGALTWASRAFISPDQGGTGNFVNIPGTAEAIGTGRKNTALILATDTNAPAAKACNDYNGGGKTDWFLPSIRELNQLYNNRTSVGNMVTSTYWSSSQYPYVSFYESAFNQNFGTSGTGGYNGKSVTCYVRAIRAF